LLVIVQARSSSKRFPNKVLHPIYGKTLIEHVILKIQKSKKVSKVIVATSNQNSDNKLVRLLKSKKINFYRGSLNNVAKRLLEVAKKYKQEYFIRISGDSPLIDYKLINYSINLIKKNKKNYDIVTNVFPKTFPSGQSIEIVNTNTLKENLRKMNKFELEHVTQFFYKNNSNFLIKNFTTKLKKKSIKLSVDKKKDLKNILSNIKKDKFNNFSIIK
jgi:spore coat polysaccharide biosynthesis protein SpsF (cytidylyltransferase family)